MEPLKIIFMRNAEFDGMSVTKQGALQLQNFAEFVGEYHEGRQGLRVLNSSEPRTRLSAKELARLLGVRAIPSAGLNHDYDGGFAQGVLRHVPKDVHVIVCVSHDKRIAAMVEELYRQDVFQGRYEDEPTTLLPNLKNGEGVVLTIDRQGGAVTGDIEFYRQPVV